MRTLKMLIRKNRIWVGLALVAQLVSNGATLIWTYLIGMLVNHIANREMPSITLLAALGCFVIINALSQYGNQLIGRYTAERGAHTLRMGFAKFLLNAGSADSAHAAMSIAQNELTHATDFMRDTLFDIAGMFITFVIVLIFLGVQNVVLTIAILVPTVLILMFGEFTGKRLSPYVNATQNEKKELNKIAFSAVQDYAAVTVFDGKDFLFGRYKEHLDKWGLHDRKRNRLFAISMSTSGALSMVPMLVLLLVGGWMVVGGHMSLGVLIIFLNLHKNLSQTIMNLPSRLLALRQFSANLDRIPIG